MRERERDTPAHWITIGERARTERAKAALLRKTSSCWCSGGLHRDTGIVRKAERVIKTALRIGCSYRLLLVSEIEEDCLGRGGKTD